MRVELSSGGKRIIDSGRVLAFDEHADITLKILDDEDVCTDIRFVFATEEGAETELRRSVEDGVAEYKCVNFSNLGTGTVAPIPIGSYDGQSVYLAFWAYLLGEQGDNAKPNTRVIDYTLFLEGKVE